MPPRPATKRKIGPPSKKNEAAARKIERWSWWFAREVVENANDLLRGSKAAPA